MRKAIRSTLVLFVVSVFYSLPAFSESWTGYGTVTQIYPYSSRGVIYVAHSGGQTECTTTDYIVLEKSAANGMSSDLLSVLLTAHSTKNPSVKILVNGCDAGNRAKIDAVLMK